MVVQQTSIQHISINMLFCGYNYTSLMTNFALITSLVRRKVLLYSYPLKLYAIDRYIKQIITYNVANGITYMKILNEYKSLMEAS